MKRILTAILISLTGSIIGGVILCYARAAYSGVLATTPMFDLVVLLHMAVLLPVTLKATKPVKRVVCN